MPPADADDPVDLIVQQWATVRPDLDASPIQVLGRISRIDIKAQAQLRAPMAAQGLGDGDFDVLAALRRSPEPGGLRPASLSRSLLVTTGAITKRLDRLEAQGLIARTPGVQDDGRGKVVRLTRRGRALVDRLIAVHLDNEARLLSALTRTERRTLATLLARLERGLP